MKLSLTNDLKLYAASMGKVFRVLAVCNTDTEANEICEKDRDLAVIAQDKDGRIYIAQQYGAKMRTADLEKLL